MTISIQNLSIVIVSFHSEDVIHDCIKSITDEIEIIVDTSQLVADSKNKSKDQQHDNGKVSSSTENIVKELSATCSLGFALSSDNLRIKCSAC